MNITDAEKAKLIEKILQQNEMIVDMNWRLIDALTPQIEFELEDESGPVTLQ